MIKLAFAVLLFGIVCSAFNLNNVYNFDEDNDYREFDQTKNFNQPENDNDDFQDFGAEFEDDEFEEIEAIQGHVKYQDVARDTLLKFAAQLRKGKNVTNAFLKVIDKFEKEIAEFHAALRRRTVKPGTISNIKDFIKEAAKDRSANTKILRELTSQGLFMAERGEKSGVRAKRSGYYLILGAAEFLNSIKDEIGEEAFDEYLSISGLVTLMFAIDDTGSMADEINAAIAISEHIVKAKRDYDVDYILSPFNDPKTGPLTRKSETEGEEFLKALRALRANGGGDCPELAFTGMINALEAGPQPGSSMFVFTDAPPKDAEDNKDIVRDLAFDLDIKINFFTTRGCGPSDALQPFLDVASETGGLVYPMKTTVDLERLGKLVSGSLQGSVAIGSGTGGSRGRRRRATDREYSISVDDSIEKISIFVTTQNSGTGISLIDPTGKTVKVGRVDLTRGVVYDIESPITGVYKLIVPAGAGEHKYRVSGVSGINVDFGHYYVAIAKRGTRIPVPLDQPLQGFPAKAFITIAGAKSVKPGSLRIKVVDKKGTVRADKPLTAVGTSGVRYFVRFNPPSGPFKLQLHGQTRKSSPFVRESSSQDQTVPVLLKLAYKEDSNILHRGQTTKIAVKILRGETGAKRQMYTLNLKDERGYGSVSRKPRLVYRGRKGFARIKFDVPADALAGKTENVKLSLTRDGEKSPVASLILSFLLV